MTTNNNNKLKFNDFKHRTIQQIRLWAWAAAVLPITALAGLFFVWKFFDGSLLGYALTIGETVMFMTAVIWWWWAMYVMRNLVNHWEDTRARVVEVLDDVRDMKIIVLEVFKPLDK